MNAQIIANQNFEEVVLQVIRLNGNEADLYFTGEQIGQALGLEEPRIAINKIFQRHQDELEEHSSVTNLVTEAGPRETRVYSEEGAYLITFFSKSPQAKEFRKWVARLLKAYRQGKVGAGPAARNRLAQMREERLSLKEHRLFMKSARLQADLILHRQATLEDLETFPLFHEAVLRLVKNDPGSKQLPLA
jgi:prophage antirepressor-like protein